MTDDNDSIARRIREMPECAHDPILYGVATSIERGNDPVRVLLGALRAYAADAARLRKVAAETIAKSPPEAVFAEWSADVKSMGETIARLTRERDAAREVARENSPVVIAMRDPDDGPHMELDR